MSVVELHRATDADFPWLLGQALATRRFKVAPDLAPPPVLEIVRSLPANWLIIAGGEIVGIIGLKSDDGREVEIGYGIAASREGRGFAGGAVAALLPILAERDITMVRAETSVDNRASQRVLERNGFSRTSERIDDEDGPLYCWEWRVP